MTTRFLLRGGCVLTLGAKTPNFAEADLLIEDGRVAEVGPGLRARDAELVDATDTIVMPGFVDTHRHAWTSLFRNLGEAAQGQLRDDITLVHCSQLDDADLEAISTSKASVSLAPSSEVAGGLGAPPIQQLIDRDIKPGLGVGDERVAPGDMFAPMRGTISMQHAVVFDLKLAGKAGVPKLMSTRDVIRCATIEGARVAGWGGVTGSLEPGMQADVIVLRTDRPNIYPINDPIGAVVWGMDTSNVDWVFSGGRVLMREGALQADVQRARDLATSARERVAVASGLVVGARGGEG